MTRRAAITAAASFALLLCGGFVLYEFWWSPATTVRVALNGDTIEISYSAPSVRGRQIFGPGGLLSRDPTYPVWRAGANFATTLRTTADLDVNGLHVPAGSYTLYIQVADPDAWQLIVSRETGQWGRSYDARRDLGRVIMTMSTPSSPVETLTYRLTDQGNGTGELRVEWERRAAAVPFTARARPSRGAKEGRT